MQRNEYNFAYSKVMGWNRDVNVSLFFFFFKKSEKIQTTKSDKKKGIGSLYDFVLKSIVF